MAATPAQRAAQRKWYAKAKKNPAVMAARREDQRQRYKNPARREARAASHRRTYQKYKDKMKAAVLAYRRRCRLQCLVAYGNACACCGEQLEPFLTIDHVNNDGAAHRRSLGGDGGNRFYVWLIKNNFPPNFQVLCYNCNCAKGHYGQCPHQAFKVEVA